MARQNKGRLTAALLVSVLLTLSFVTIHRLNPLAEVKTSGRKWWPWTSWMKTDSTHLPLSVGSPDKVDANVFLIDSSNTSHPTFRALCAVESWALRNPHLDVWFLLTSHALDNTDLLASHLLHRYPNLRVARAPLRLFRGTPLLNLYSSDAWRAESAWPVNQLSNMLRVVYLWRWGGVYSDTDVVCLRPFTLPLNAVGFSDPGAANNAIMGFTRGHAFLMDLMDDMVKHYKPGHWGSIGPAAVTRVLQDWCGASTLAAQDGYKQLSCGNVTVYPRHYFYPLRVEAHHRYSDADSGNYFDKQFRETFALHTWNRFSRDHAFKAGSRSIYDLAATAHCPLTYRHAALRSSYF